jgi:NitT/TauT family transport system substrate-binding protein
MRGFVLAALALAALVPSSGIHQLTRVDVSLGDVSINKVPQLVAADQGLYAKYGLDVRLTISASAARTAAASGVVVPDAYVNRDDSVAAPIEVGGGSPMIYAFVTKARGPARVIVLTQEAMVVGHVIARTGIAGIQDLKGKRIGFTGVGSVTHFSALSLARQLGWSPDREITLVAGSATLDALKQEKVDAILASAMVIALASQAGFKDIGDLTAYKMPMAGSGIMVDKAYLAAHRDTVLRYLKADIAATALMQRDRRVFNAALAKWFNITDARTQDGMFAHVHKFEKKPYPSVEGIKQVFALYDSPEMRRHTPEEFYDSSLMAELDKSGLLDNPK